MIKLTTRNGPMYIKAEAIEAVEPISGHSESREESVVWTTMHSFKVHETPAVVNRMIEDLKRL